MKASNTSRTSFLLSFVDLLLACLATIFCLYIFSMLLMASKKAQDQQVPPKAEYEIVMSWKPATSANDIDLWVLPPNGTAIGYPHMENTYMYLNHDDLGITNNVAIINGKPVQIPGHQEVVTIRKVVPGHYVVNAEYFQAHKNIVTGVFAPYDVPVKIELVRVNPTYALITKSKFVLHQPGDEHTAFSFDVESDGKVDHITTGQDPFVFEPQSNPWLANPFD